MNAEIQNPYPGPESFERNDNRPFFGREQETRDLSPMIVTQRLLVYYAPSGAGKTSLLNKRLIPRLEEKMYEVLPRGRVSGVSTLPDAVDNVYAYNLMLRLAPNDPEPQRFAGLKLSDFLWHLTTEDGHNYTFDSSEHTLRRQTPVQSLWPRVLILDQFEEIVTSYPAYWQHREEFFRQLNDALLSDPMLRMVICLRSDFVQDLERYAGLLEQGLRARYQMFLMNKADALNAIEGPAAEYGRPFAAGVAARLVENLSQVRDQHADGTIYTVPGESVEPIQLQVVCYQLWDSMHDAPGDSITMDDLARLARASLAPQPAQERLAAEEDEDKLLAIFVDGALRAFYERALERARSVVDPIFDEAYLRSWFSTQLITENGARGFLQRGHEETAGVPDVIVQSLVDGHLLRSDTRGSVRLVELIHDRFVDPIREANLLWNERRRREQPWIDTAYRWYESGASPETRDATILLLGAALKAVLDERGEQQLEPMLEEYLDACIAAQARSEQQAALESERRKTEVAQRQAELEASTARQLSRQKKWLAALAGIALVSLVIALLLAINLNNQNQTLSDKQDALNTQTRQLEQQQEDLSIANRKLRVGASVLERTVQSLEAARAENQSLILADKSYLGSTTEDSLLLARAAYTYSDTLPAEAALLSALDRSYRDSNGAMLSFVPSEPLVDADRGPWSGIAFSKNANLMALGSTDGDVELWDNAAGVHLADVVTSQSGYEMHALAFDPSGTRLATIGSNRNDAEAAVHELVVWDLSDLYAPMPMILAANQPSVFAVEFSADGTNFATANQDGRVDLWDISGAEPISRTLPGRHTDWAFALAFSPDGSRLASAGRDGVIILWGLDSSMPVSQTLTEHTMWINEIEFSPDGSQLASASDDGTVRLWDLSDDPPTSAVLDQDLSTGAEAWTLAFAPDDSDRLAVGWRYGAVRIYDLQHPDSEPWVLRRENDGIRNLAFDPSDTNRLISVSEYGYTPIEWKLVAPTQFASTQKISLPESAKLRAISPDGNWTVAVAEDNSIAVNSLLTGSLLISIPASSNITVTAVALSDEAELLAVAACSDVVPPSKPAALQGSTESPPGNCQLYVTSPRQPEGTLHATVTFSQSIRALAFRPGSVDELAVGLEAGEVQPLDLRAPAPVNLPERIPEIVDLAFSDHGDFLAGLGKKGKVVIWNWVDREKLDSSEVAEDAETSTRNVSGRSSDKPQYESLDFVNQDTWLAITTSAFAEPQDVTQSHVVFLELQGLSRVASFLLDFGSAEELVLDPVQRALVALRGDRLVTWPIEPATWLDLACVRAGRNLEYYQWQAAFTGETDFSTARICPMYALDESFVIAEMDKATREIDDCTVDGLRNGMEILRTAETMPVNLPRNFDPLDHALQVLSTQALDHLSQPSEIYEVDALACLRRASDAMKDAGEEPIDPQAALAVGKSMMRAKAALVGAPPIQYAQVVDELEYVLGHPADWPIDLPEARQFLPQAYYGLCLKGDAEGCRRLAVADELLKYGEPVYTTYRLDNTDPIYFFGAQGDIAAVSMQSQEFDTFLKLQGPGDLELSNDDTFGTNSYIEFTVPQDGYYSVLPGAYSGEGTYRLTLERFAPAILDMNEPISSTSRTTTYWTFDGQQGDVVSVTVAYSDTSFAPVLRLLRSDLTVLAESSATTESTMTGISPQLLPADGSYVLKVTSADAQGGNAGQDTPYTIHAATTELPPIAVGDHVTATTKTNTMWAVQGQAGQIIDIAITVDPNSGFDPVVELLGVDGAGLAWNDDYAGGLNSLITGFVLTQTAPYYLQVGRPDSDVPYTLTVTLTPVRTLLPGETRSLTQTEVVTFTGDAGETFILSAQPETTIALVGPAGASAVYASAVMTQMNAATVITALVSPASYAYTATVRLDIVPDEVDLVPIGRSSVRELAGGDVDVIGFSVITETGVAISITPSVEAPVIDLFDPSGAHLTHGTATTIRALPVAGDYLLMVRAPDVDPTGAYTISLTAVDVVPVPQACTPGAEPDYGPIRTGSAVILGRHRPVNGDAHWDANMHSYVGMNAVVTGLGDADSAGCPVVWVDVDGGWNPWRIRDLVILR